MSEPSLAPPQNRDSVAQDVIGWSAVAVGAMGTLAVFSRRVLEVGPEQCALRVLAGIPCPVCGLSTSALGLLRGDVLDAVRFDLLGAGFLTVMAGLAVMQVGSATGFTRWRPNPTMAGLVVMSLLLGHWLATVTGAVHLAPLT